MNKQATAFFTVIVLSGCASTADYGAAIANNGSFSAYDQQFRVESKNYPVFALASTSSMSAPRYGVNQGRRFEGAASPDLLPTDRWEVTHDVNGQYLIYSENYDHRFCVMHASPPLPPFKKDADRKCLKDQGGLDKIYIYVKENGIAYGWQFLRNSHLALWKERMSWFRVENTGIWSDNIWFKCVERCDKLSNMKNRVDATAARTL